MMCMSELPASFPGRAEVEKAACERSSLLLVGPPGLGATMLARRAASILPGPAAVESTYRAAGLEPPAGRPFRAPHHTVSSMAIVGSPERPEDRERRFNHRPARPGEMALANGGVLYLDELPEFTESTIQAIARLYREGSSMGFACRPALILASAAPCPCGWKGTQRSCVCQPGAIERYTLRRNRYAKILGIHCSVASGMVSLAELRTAPRGEDSATIRARVEVAWAGGIIS